MGKGSNTQGASKNKKRERDADSKGLSSSKEIYKKKPKTERIDDPDVKRCGIKPLSTALSSTIVNLDYYAAATCFVMNDLTGFIPIQGTENTSGAFELYYAQCLYAYLMKAGVVSGDTSKAAAFLKYSVPTSVAIAFQQCAPWLCDRTQKLISMDFHAFTQEYIDGLAVYETVRHAYCVTGTQPSFGGEPLFGTGDLIHVSDFEPSQWKSISEKISGAMESVVVSEIGELSPTHHGLVYKNAGNGFRSFRHIPQGYIGLAISRLDEMVSPAVTYQAPWCMNGENHSDSHGAMIGWAVHSLADVEYNKSITWKACYDKIGANPDRVNFEYEAQSYVKFLALLIDWMIVVASFVAWDTNRQKFLVYSHGAFLGSVMSSTCFLSRPVSHGVNVVPTYVAPTYNRIKLPSWFLGFGGMPTRVDDTIIIPYFTPPTQSVASLFQSSGAWSPTWSGEGINPNDFGNVPFAATFGTIDFAGLPIPAAGVPLNFTALRLVEELESTMVAVMTAYQSNCIVLPTTRQYCPCGTGLTTGANTYAVAGFTLTYPLMYGMYCLRPVSGLDCKLSASVGLTNFVTKALYWRSAFPASQNPFRAATDSSQLVNNVPQFAMGNASTGGDLVKGATSYFFSQMAGSAPANNYIISGAKLLDAAYQAIHDGTPLGSPPPEAFWRELGKKPANFLELVNKVAAGIKFVSPHVVSAVRAYNAIQTYVPNVVM